MYAKIFLRIIVLVALLLGGAGSCSTNRSVEIQVTGLDDKIVFLKVIATYNGKDSLPESVTRSLDNFIMRLKSDVHGAVKVKVLGFESNQCATGSGEGTIDILGNIDGPLIIPFMRFEQTACRVEWKVTGGGEAKIQTIPEGIACGSQCRLFPVGTQIRISPQAAWNSEFRKWKTGCSAIPCDVLIRGDEPIQIEAYVIKNWQCDASNWCKSLEFASSSFALMSISGTGADDVWAVGETILHWDGLSWRQAPVKNPIANVYELDYSIRADLSGQHWIASKGGIRGWDGQIWSELLRSNCELHGIWGSSKDDIWAVGCQDSILHWDGLAWNNIDLGFSIPDRFMISVWGTSSKNALAVGFSGSAMKWDGVQWRLTSGPPMQYPSKLWSPPGANYIWAVGYDGAIAKHDGYSWSTSPSPTLAGLRDIWGTSETNIWAVGELGTILRWDGNIWRSVPSGTSKELVGVWGSDEGSVWAVGFDMTILKWNGIYWSPAPLEFRDSLIKISGRSNSINEFYAIGFGGRIKYFNGVQWEDFESLQNVELSDIWIEKETGFVWVIGKNGFIAQYSFAWVQKTVPTTKNLNAMWGNTKDDIWAVGDSGTVLHWDGANWLSIPAPASVDLTTVWAGTPSYVWAASAGRIFFWDGTRWTENASPTNTISGFKFYGSDVWLVGDGIFRWDGKSWKTSFPKTGFGTQWTDIWGQSESDVYAVGWGGKLMHWDGTAWTAIDLGSSDVFRSIWGTTQGDIWIVGASEIFRHAPNM